jgi:hypothetical protein
MVFGVLQIAASRSVDSKPHDVRRVGTLLLF